MFNKIKKYKLYFKVAKNDRYAMFYSILNGKINDKNINRFIKKYRLNEEEKKVFILYMKKEKISYIAEVLSTSERRINRVLEIILNKVLMSH